MQGLGLSSNEILTVGKCLKAAAEGPFFPEWEFQTLIGWSRAEVHQVANAWPSPAIAPRELAELVVAVLNNLVGYPHGQDSCWSAFIDVPPAEVTRLLEALVVRLRTDSPRADG